MASEFVVFARVDIFQQSVAVAGVAEVFEDEVRPYGEGVAFGWIEGYLAVETVGCVVGGVGVAAAGEQGPVG